ncbi:hypothetical protein [Phreatobacter sp.]|uniref:hypothetical protein n=1 Tax=Phreatobacter sp. TaxID=1966341 RepID=UPI003F722B3F
MTLRPFKALRPVALALVLGGLAATVPADTAFAGSSWLFWQHHAGPVIYRPVVTPRTYYFVPESAHPRVAHSHQPVRQPCRDAHGRARPCR